MAFRDYLPHNFKWKMASLLLSILIWFIITLAMKSNLTNLRFPFGDGMTRTFFRHGINVITSASDPRQFTIAPQEVNVTVRSSAVNLDELTDADLEVFVNLTGMMEEEKIVSIQVGRPNFVSVVKVDPPAVRVVRILHPAPASSP